MPVMPGGSVPFMFIVHGIEREVDDADSCFRSESAQVQQNFCPLTGSHEYSLCGNGGGEKTAVGSNDGERQRCIVCHNAELKQAGVAGVEQAQADVSRRYGKTGMAFIIAEHGVSQPAHLEVPGGRGVYRLAGWVQPPVVYGDRQV